MMTIQTRDELWSDGLATLGWRTVLVIMTGSSAVLCSRRWNTAPAHSRSVGRDWGVFRRIPTFNCPQSARRTTRHMEVGAALVLVERSGEAALGKVDQDVESMVYLR